MFHGHLDYFQKPPLGSRPNTKPEDHGTPNTHNRKFILFYQVRRPACIKIHQNNIWLRSQSHMTSHYTGGSVTTLQDVGGVLGRPLTTFLLGSYNFMVTALGSCVKCPIELETSVEPIAPTTQCCSRDLQKPLPGTQWLCIWALHTIVLRV